MAAASYTTDLAVLSVADATTGFTEPTSGTAGGTPVLEADYFIQGTNCVSKTFNAAGLGGLMYTAGAGVTIPTDGAAFHWIYFAAPNAVDTKANGGIQICIGNSNAAYKKFYVAGSDTYTYGGWVNYPVNPTVTQSATIGSPTAVTQAFGWVANVVNPISKGNPFGVDAMRYGRGTLQVTGGDLANGYGTFNGASVQNDLLSNRWGILSLIDGSYKYQGHLLLGTAGTSVDFRDSNKAVIIQNTQFVTSNFNLIEVRNALSNINFTSISISSLGTISRGNFLVTDNAVVLLDGCTFTDMGAFTYLSNTTSNDTVYRRCGLITHGSAIFTNNTVTGSYATSAMTSSNPSNIQDCNFISAGTGHAITITTAGTYTFSGNQFTGYGTAGTTNAAIYNNSGGLVTLNISNGTTPTIRNGAGASTVVNNSVSLTISGNVTLNGAEVRIYDLDNAPAGSLGTELSGIESNSTSNYVYSGGAGNLIWIQVMKIGYVEYGQSITMPSSNTTIDIILAKDNNI